MYDLCLWQLSVQEESLDVDEGEIPSVLDSDDDDNDYGTPACCACILLLVVDPLLHHLFEGSNREASFVPDNEIVVVTLLLVDGAKFPDFLHPGLALF
jgi:hypothetical protein